MTNRIYKTSILVEVLSDEPYQFESVAQVAYDITKGGCSGDSYLVEGKENVVLEGEEALKACEARGIDPGYFLLTEDL